MPNMLRRTLLLSALSSACAVPALAAFEPTPHDRADIARIEAYLNGLTSLRAKFLQVAPDGGISGGQAWLSRPGRLRFQYDPPAPFLLVAAHGQLVFQDSSIKQTSQAPLSSTPLGMLLAPKVVLSGEITVTGMRRLPGEIDVSIVRTAAPGDGALTLVFADTPLTLRQWTVTDAQQKETRVTLFNTELGGNFDAKLFEPVPMPSSAGGGG
jgi:outer membrane lipoprotein-sorting protein